MQRISVDPNPPVRGQTAVISYDFSGTGVTETTLRVTFDSDPSTTHVVSLENPSFEVEVPAHADRLLVEDEGGFSDDLSVACEDPAGVGV